MEPSARLQWGYRVTMITCAGGESDSQENRPMSGVLGGASDLGEPSNKGRAPALGDTSDRRAAPVQERSQRKREVPLHTYQ